MTEELKNQTDFGSDEQSGIGSQEPQEPQEPQKGFMDRLSTRQKIILGIIVAVVVLGSIIAVSGNWDEPCTITTENQRTINIDGACTGGAWGDWETVSSTDDNGVRIVVQSRVYTGTRDLRRIFNEVVETRGITDVERAGSRCITTSEDFESFITDINPSSSMVDFMRNAFTTQRAGESRVISVEVISESAACQIENTQSIRYTGCNSGTGSCDGDGDGDGDGTGDVVDSTTVTTTSDDTDTTTDVITSEEDLLEFRRGLISTSIGVNPELVRFGDSTTVNWTTVETESCTVTAQGNDDSWVGTSGDEVSAPIDEETTYTLSCIDAVDGNQMPDEQVTVYVLPAWNEE